MWYIVVLFLSFNYDGSQNLYVFSEPTFNDFYECAGSASDPQQIPIYMEQMLLEYRGKLPGPVDKVSCINQEVYDELLRMKDTVGT